MARKERRETRTGLRQARRGGLLSPLVGPVVLCIAKLVRGRTATRSLLVSGPPPDGELSSELRADRLTHRPTDRELREPKDREPRQDRGWLADW